MSAPCSLPQQEDDRLLDPTTAFLPQAAFCLQAHLGTAFPPGQIQSDPARPWCHILSLTT